jgi:hypothetical protein
VVECHSHGHGHGDGDEEREGESGEELATPHRSAQLVV